MAETFTDWLNEHELPDICNHYWWVVGVPKDKRTIIVECRGSCEAIGTIRDATLAEYNKALLSNYRWTDNDRVTLWQPVQPTPDPAGVAGGIGERDENTIFA